jgi:putative intracellular protease/amidase
VANKTVLCAMSEFGYWGEELVGPLYVLDNAGSRGEFVTPTGRRPRALPPSTDEVLERDLTRWGW